jgi:hypothetical protein
MESPDARSSLNNRALKQVFSRPRVQGVKYILQSDAKAYSFVNY